MTFGKVLILASLMAAVVSPAPQFGPSPTYSYRFEGPEQSKEESRDSLGNIKGSYTVTYPNGGGTLTYSYAHPAALPVFRTTADGPLGPAGTVISFGKKNSKDSAFLIEMLEQRLDSREPPVFTKTEAVLIEALPDTVKKAPSTSVLFEAGPGAKGASQNTIAGSSVGPITRDKFINSKESAFLPAIRRESQENAKLGGRNPPKVTNEAIIVDAASD